MSRRHIPKGTAMIDVGLYVGVKEGSKVGLSEGKSITHFASKVDCFLLDPCVPREWCCRVLQQIA